MRSGSGASERKLGVGSVGVAEDFLVEGNRKVAEGTKAHPTARNLENELRIDRK